MTTVECFAPAKVNLTLHVTGRRPAGYHLLDSIVVFADAGDTIAARYAERLSLTIGGPFGAGLSEGEDNLVLRAARLLAPERGAAIALEKGLPVASGIGGGSADAAATLRALARLWALPLPGATAAASLGADVPVCLAGVPARMRGIGDRLDPLPPLPPMRLVLVNPGVAVPTRAVFSALESPDNPPMAGPLPDTRAKGFDGWAEWLRQQRNDLEAPAVSLFPVIGQVLEALAALPGCRLSRMSGSGATCFGLFPGGAIVDTSDLRRRHPGWWIAEAEVRSAAPEARAV